MEIGFQRASFLSFYGMAQVAEVLVALKRLSEDDLRVLAETTKKCVAESKKRKIEEDSSSTFPLNGRAAAMKVQQTFPVILITSEDLANLKESGNPNLIINSLTHGKESDEKISLLCVNQEINEGFIVQDVVFNDIPNLPMVSTSVGEEVVFIYCRSSFQQEFVNGGALNSFTNPAEARIYYPKSIPFSKGRFFVMTNRGNIFSGYLHKKYCWPLVDLHPQFFVDPHGEIIESFQMNYENSLEDDELCFVPQIFVELISVSTQLFEAPSNFPHEGGKRHSDEYDLKQKFKVLCRQYNKMRQGQELTIKDLSNQLGVLGEELQVQVGQKMEMEKLLFEAKAMLQDFWKTQQTDIVLRSFIQVNNNGQPPGESVDYQPTILDDLKDLKVFGKSVVELFQSQASVIDLLHTEVQRRETEAFLKEEKTSDEISCLQEELLQTKEELSQTKEALSQTKEELLQTKEELSFSQDTHYDQLHEQHIHSQDAFNAEFDRSQEEFRRSQEELHLSQEELRRSQEEASKMKVKVSFLEKGGKDEKKSWFWN